MWGEFYAVIKVKKLESVVVLKEIVNNYKKRMDKDKNLRATTSSFLRRMEICASNGGSHFEAELIVNICK